MPILAFGSGINKFNTSQSAASPNLSTFVSGTGTTAKIFPLANTVNATLSGNPCVIGTMPGAGRLEATQFQVVAGGFVTCTGTTPTIQIGLYANNLTTPASPFTASNWTNIWLGTAYSVPTTTTRPWSVRAYLQGDSVSGILQGYVNDMVGSVAINAQAALTNQLTGVNFGVGGGSATSPTFSGPASNEPPIVFAVGITFTVSNAANYAQLEQFMLWAD